MTRDVKTHKTQKQSYSSTFSLLSTWALLLFAWFLLYTPRDELQSTTRKHGASTTLLTALSKASHDMLNLICISYGAPFNETPAK